MEPPGHPSKKATGATNTHRAHQTKDLPLGGARRSCGRGTLGLRRRTGTGICDSRPGLRDAPTSVRSPRARVCGPGPGLRRASLVVASPLAVAASPRRRTLVDHVHQRPGVLGHLELLPGQDGRYEALRRIGLGSSSRNHPEPEPWRRYGYHWTKVQWLGGTVSTRVRTMKSGGVSPRALERPSANHRGSLGGADTVTEGSTCLRG